MGDCRSLSRCCEKRYRSSIVITRRTAQTGSLRCLFLVRPTIESDVTPAGGRSAVGFFDFFTRSDDDEAYACFGFERNPQNGRPSSQQA